MIELEYKLLNRARVFIIEALEGDFHEAGEGLAPLRENFCVAFRTAQDALNLSDLDLAKMFEISRPTVGRWARGEACVHPVGRKPILEHLLKLVSERMLAIEKGNI